MDIDLLWVPGGWITLFGSNNFMAKLSLFESTTKSQATLFFLVLLLVLPLLFARPYTELSKSSMAVSSSSFVEFHPKEAHANNSIAHQQLGASAHEVPSGPNPDSNK